MTARSAVHVHVVSKNGAQRAWLRPGDEVPSWARLDERNLLASDGTSDDPGTGGAITEPARSGKGSGVEAWRSFAEAKGVGVDSDMSRDDIIAACQQAGVLASED